MNARNVIRDLLDGDLSEWTTRKLAIVNATFVAVGVFGWFMARATTGPLLDIFGLIAFLSLFPALSLGMSTLMRLMLWWNTRGYEVDS